ncbi:MAG: thiamine pyrophosphate-dependent enzyme [Nitrososphaerales archaeon]
MGKEDILVSDVGAHKLWIARMYPTYEPNTVIILNGFSSMGIAIPGAIAAKLIHPHRKIVAVCGDGGFLMSSYELETAKRIKTHITIVIFRDNAYGLVRWKQQTMHKREDSSIIGNPDFVKYAEAFGAVGYRVNRAQDLESVLREALEKKICSVIDIPVDYGENMKLTMKFGEFVCPT